MQEADLATLEVEDEAVGQIESRAIAVDRLTVVSHELVEDGMNDPQLVVRQEVLLLVVQATHEVANGEQEVQHLFGVGATATGLLTDGEDHLMVCRRGQHHSRRSRKVGHGHGVSHLQVCPLGIAGWIYSSLLR